MNKNTNFIVTSLYYIIQSPNVFSQMFRRIHVSKSTFQSFRSHWASQLTHFVHQFTVSAHDHRNDYATYCQRPIIIRLRQTHTDSYIKRLLKDWSFKRIVSAHFWSFFQFCFSFILSSSFLCFVLGSLRKKAGVARLRLVNNFE